MISVLRRILRLAFYGIGLGVFLGTGMRLLYPGHIKGYFPIEEVKPITTLLNPFRRQVGLSFKLDKVISDLKKNRFNPKNELTGLSLLWKKEASMYKGLEASALLLILDDGSYASLAPLKSLPAASAIKVPILLSALQMIDSKKITWNEPLKLTQELIGGGAGWMAYEPVGSFFPVFEVATEMIRVSDNTATNLLIKRIGGKNLLNTSFKDLGLTNTGFNNWLPDLSGTNTTSVRDLVLSIALVESGSVLSLRTRDLFRGILSTSVSNRLIPGGLLKGLGGSQINPDDGLFLKGFKVLNKTGDIGTAYVDVGLIEMPNNTRAIAAFIVTGPFNDPRSTQLIRDMASAMASVLNPKI